MSGYVLIHRDLIGNPQFRGKDDEYAAMWLVAKAAWEPTTIRVNREAVTLERGQCAFTIGFLATAWECSKATAHARVRHLSGVGFIRTRAERGYTVITLCKYDEYQASPNDTRTQGSVQPERQPNDARTKINEGNEGKEIYPPPIVPPPAAERPVTEDTPEFSAWWEAYPRHVGKGAARKAYIRAAGKATVQELLAGARRYAAARLGQDPSYTAHPATWLNQERWTDDGRGEPALDQFGLPVEPEIDWRNHPAYQGVL